MKNSNIPFDLIVILHLGLFVIFCESAAISSNQSQKLSPAPKLVVLSYDGFRFDYMNKASTPTLDLFKSEGVSTPYMTAQFSTKTFPNHQSIATGLHTESHGIMDNSVYDPKYESELNGYVKYDERFWNFNNDVVPVWILNEWGNDGRKSGASWPGSNHPYGHNATKPSHYLTYNKSLSFEARMDFVVDWLTDKEKPANLVFMYFDEPDGVGHAYGPESPQTVEEIRRMDKLTQYLIDKLTKENIYNDVNIIILSDHGFEEVTRKNMINITSMMNKSLYKSYGWTPVVQIDPADGKLEEVYKGFKIGSEGKNFSVYKKEDLPTEWHYQHNRRIRPILLVADPGYVFDDFEARMETLNKRFNLKDDDSTTYGVHGYDNRAVNMRSFFLARGPAFKKGVEINPFSNLDLFPLICKMMGISTPPNNGSLNIVEGALTGKAAYIGRPSSLLGTVFIISQLLASGFLH